jgi:hypothetical protein
MYARHPSGFNAAATQRSGGGAPLLPTGPQSPCDHPTNAAAGIAGTVHQTAHRGRPGRSLAFGRRVKQSGTRHATPLDLSATASPFNATTEVCDRFWMKRYGPSRRRALDASVALGIFVHHPEKQQYRPPADIAPPLDMSVFDPQTSSTYRINRKRCEVDNVPLSSNVL